MKTLIRVAAIASSSLLLVAGLSACKDNTGCGQNNSLSFDASSVLVPDAALPAKGGGGGHGGGGGGKGSGGSGKGSGSGKQSGTGGTHSGTTHSGGNCRNPVPTKKAS